MTADNSVGSLGSVAMQSGFKSGLHFSKQARKAAKVIDDLVQLLVIRRSWVENQQVKKANNML